MVVGNQFFVQLDKVFVTLISIFLVASNDDFAAATGCFRENDIDLQGETKQLNQCHNSISEHIHY